MFFNNVLRPAVATAGCSNAASERSRKYGNIAYNVGQAESADEFGSFYGGEQQSAPKNTQRRKPSGGSVKPNIPWKMILAIVAAVAVVTVLAVIIIAIFSTPRNGIKMEDNVFFSYADAEGKYHVVSNGKTIKNTFEGEITIKPAKDNSFAYIIEEAAAEDTANVKMYILKGTKLELIKAKATNIVAMSDYAPGIIYKEGNVYHYYSSSSQSPITRESSAANFIISGDASTVIYTTNSKIKADETEMKYFRNSNTEKLGPNNFTPVGISNDGKTVYGINGAGSLYYISTKSKKSKEKAIQIANSEGTGVFENIIGMNANGNEIVFTVNTLEKGSVSYLFDTNGNKLSVIADGVFKPISSDKKIACPDTFVNSYFVCTRTETDEEGNSEEVTATFYLDKGDGIRKVVNAIGEFSPDGKYLYYMYAIDDGYLLYRIDVTSKKFAKSEQVMDGIAKFSLDEKGNIYMLYSSAGGDKASIYYKNAETGTPQRISFDADPNSMEICGNSVYFSETDENDNVVIKVSTGGAEPTVAEFKSSSPTETPTMFMGSGNKGYACFVDASGNTKLFYTENGKKFTLVNAACSVTGFDEGTPTPENPNASGTSTGNEEN